METSGNLTSGGAAISPQSRDIPNYHSAIYLNTSDLSGIMSPWAEDETFIPTVITYSLTFVLGIIGNLAVVFSLVFDRKARNVTSYFLISLAVADLAFLVIWVPYKILLESNATWAGGPVLCKLAGFVEMLSAVASVMNLMAVSIERYIVIVHPMKSRSWCTMGNTKKLILAVWVIATLLSSPLLHIMVRSSPLLHIMDAQSSTYYNNITHVVTISCMEYNVGGPVEWLVFAYYRLMITFGIPVIVMLYCYTVVIHVLWSSTKTLDKMTNQAESRLVNTNNDHVTTQRLQVPNQHGRGHVTRGVKDTNADVREARKQVIRMLLVIITVFCVCWGPTLILHTLKRHELAVLHHDGAYYVNLVAELLPYIHSCLNPIIYGFMSKNFRRSMRIACRSCTNRKCCGGNRLPLVEIEMDNKSTNGRYSPSRSSANTNYTSVQSECHT